MSGLESLRGKRILFFCVQTFNLEKDIIEQLEKHGAIVTYFDERPKNNNFTKGMIRLNRGFLEKKINNYYTTILDNLKEEKFDFLFVNRGEVVTRDFMQKFIKIQPNCKRIFYTWDSIGNHSHCVEILDCFHKRFTFDQNDAKKYKLGFRPLYFTDRFREIYNSEIEKVIDLLFLGTAHSDRYIVSSNIAEWCKNQGLNAFNYYYMQGRFVYFFKKFFDRTFFKFDYKKLSFKSLNNTEIVEFYTKSNVILDISHPGQSGLTMRTFEAIGSGKKLITTNENIVNYPFYNPNNIYVIRRDIVELDIDFFSKEYQPLSIDLYEQCSLDGWIKDIFIGDETNYWGSNLKL